MADCKKSAEMKKKPRYRRQFGALPLRMDAEGRIEVMMVTSRETRRWIVPKGWPIKGLTGSGTAACEAREEAGVTGIISKKPIGAYTYGKRLKDGSSICCCVELYPLWVVDDMQEWPENGERDIAWLSLADAAERAGDASLAALLQTMRDEGLPRACYKLYLKAQRVRNKHLLKAPEDAEAYQETSQPDVRVVF